MDALNDFLAPAIAWTQSSWHVLSQARADFLMAAAAIVATIATWTAARLDEMSPVARFAVYLLILVAGVALMLAAVTFSPVLVDPAALADSQRLQVLPE
jgi:hypothetical protein